MANIFRHRGYLAKVFAFIAAVFVAGLFVVTPLGVNFDIAYSSEESDALTLSIHFVDVGQGDCILIELPDGKNMLIDAGPTSATEKVVSYIKSQKIKTIDYLIITHSDEDHCGGAVGVINNFEVKHIFRPFALATNNSIDDFVDELDGQYLEGDILFVDTYSYAAFIDAAYNEEYTDDNNTELAKIEVSYDGRVILPENSEINYFIEFHHPPKASENQIASTRTDGYPTKYYSDSNTMSAIVSLEYANEKFLFTGDATKKAEDEFINNLPKYGEPGYTRVEAVRNITLLKVAHHGSKNSSTQAFLDFVSPSYAVIMCGIDNTFRHPDPSIINRLEGLWSNPENRILRTDLNGNIKVETNGKGLSFALEKIPSNQDNTTDKKDKWVLYVIFGGLVVVVVASVVVKILQDNREKDKATPKDTKKQLKNQVKKVIREAKRPTKYPNKTSTKISNNKRRDKV